MHLACCSVNCTVKSFTNKIFACICLEEKRPSKNSTDNLNERNEFPGLKSSLFGSHLRTTSENFL